VQREQHGQKAGEGHQRLGRNRVGERQRDRRHHVAAVGDGQAPQRPHGADQAERHEGEQDQVLGGDHERVARGDGEVDGCTRPRQQLPRPVERGHGAVPHADERSREHPHPLRLGGERRRRVGARQREVADERAQAEGDQADPQRVGSHAEARSPGAGARARSRRTARPVDVQQGERDEEHDPGAARGRGQHPEHAGPGPAVDARGVDRTQRQRQEQRLAVDGREAVGRGEDGEQDHGRAGRIGADLQHGQAVQDGQRDQQRGQRERDPGHDRRAGQRLKHRHEQRVQGKERRPSGLAVAVVGDRQVPDGVPAGGGRHEPVRRAAERRRHRARVEVAPAARPADGRQAREAAGPHHEPAPPQRPPRGRERRAPLGGHRRDRALRRGGARPGGRWLGGGCARALHVRLRSSHPAARAGSCTGEGPSGSG
jgi:hypothetical protein